VFKLLILVKSSKDLLGKNFKRINSVFKSEKEILKINKRFYMKYKGKYFSAQRHLIHQYIHIETVVQLSCNTCPNIYSCMFTDFPGDY
jgi:hypothetical protein